VFAPFALFPIPVAAPLWLVTQGASALAAIYALGRRLFASTLRRDLPVLVAFTVASQPVWVLAEGGNVGGFLLAIAATSAALLLADRPFAAGAVAGLLVIKPHPLLIAIPLLLLALPRDRAARMAAGGMVVAAPLVVVTLALRPTWIGEWLLPLGRISAAPVGRATLFGILPPEVRPLGWIVVIAIVVAFALWSRGRPLPLVIGAAIPLAIFCAPYGWSYDHTVLFVTAAVIIALVARAPASLRMRVLILLALVTVPLPWVLYVTAFSRGEESWSIATPLALLATLAISARAVTRAYGTMPP
jgi:hypothetical protein